nr:MAG TPA: replication protein P [Caudoviricetes sp.]
MTNITQMQAEGSAVKKSNIPDNAVRLIDRMFIRLKSIFPAWKQAFASEAEYNETKQVWLEELFKAGVVNPQSLKRGLDLAAKSESPFFPSVGQFIAWCEFENYHELGLPTPEELSSRIQKYFGYAKEPHNFKFRSKAEYYLLKTIYDGYSKKKWEDCQRAMPKILAEVVEKARTGFEFPQIPELLEQKPKIIPPEVSKNGLAKIKEIMGIA